MKFVKANLDLVITGVIVVLALVVSLWWFNGKDQEKINEAKNRLAISNNASNLIFTSAKPLDIPGHGKIPAANEPPVTYTPNITEAKAEAISRMKQEAQNIRDLASANNYKNRVDLEVVRGSKPEARRSIPYLMGKKEENFLPVTQGTSLAFKSHYLAQFEDWYNRLAGRGPFPLTLKDEVDQQIRTQNDAKNRAALAGGGGSAGQPGGRPVAGGVDTLTLEERSRIVKGVISNRAASIRCYVDDNALQKRNWATTATPPNELEIFEGFVDSWLQNDVVNAISQLNDQTLKTQNRHPDDRHVGYCPVKRLESISIGGASNGSGGSIFVSMTASQFAAAGSGTVSALPSSPGGLDFTRSFTGHVGSTEYDVVWMTIKIDIDPAYENKFYESLYKQNNGYTILNVKTKPVDPLDAASFGYLYGETQVVQLEIQVENILFRTWTLSLMPNTLRQALGLPALTPGKP